MQSSERVRSYAAAMRTGWPMMTRKQEKPIPTAPAMSSTEYEAAVAAFIRSKGVTRCPTACLVRTQASVPTTDREALEEYETRRARSRRTNFAATANLLGVFVPPLSENAPNRAREPIPREAQTTPSQRIPAISTSS